MRSACRITRMKKGAAIRQGIAIWRNRRRFSRIRSRCAFQITPGSSRKRRNSITCARMRLMVCFVPLEPKRRKTNAVTMPQSALRGASERSALIRGLSFEVTQTFQLPDEFFLRHGLFVICQFLLDGVLDELFERTVACRFGGAARPFAKGLVQLNGWL